MLAGVFDATDPAGRQDMAIAARVADEGRALVILLNKWDLVRDRTAARKAVHDRLEGGARPGEGGSRW